MATAKININAKNNTQGAFDSIEKGMLKFAAKVATTTYAIKKLADLAIESAQAYDVQIKAENNLASAIKATGGDVTTVLGRYKALASAIQASTDVGDEQVLQLQAQARFLGVTDEAMKSTIEGTIGLSKTMGIGLSEALKKTAQAANGNYEAMNEVIPELKTLTSDSDKAALIQKKLADAFQSAQDEAKGGLGPYRQLTNAIGDSKEQFGSFVLKGLNPFIMKLTEMVTASNNARSALQDLKKVATEGMQGQSTSVLEGAIAAKEKQIQTMITDFKNTESAGAVLDEKKITRLQNEIGALKVQLEKEKYLQLAKENYSKAVSTAEKKKADADLKKAEDEKKVAQEKVAELSQGSDMSVIQPYNSFDSSGGYDTSKQAPLPQESSGGFFSELMEGIQNLIGGFNPVIEMLNVFASFTPLLNPLLTIFQGIMSVLQPIIDSLLRPLIGILRIIGVFLGTVLSPILMLLEIPIRMVAKAFVFIYNYALRPFANLVIKLMVTLWDAFRGAINAIIKLINKLPGVHISKIGGLDVNYLDKISMEDLNDAGATATATGSSSSGTAASYTGAKELYINIYFNNSYVNGDSRQISLALWNEIKSAQQLGIA